MRNALYPATVLLLMTLELVGDEPSTLMVSPSTGEEYIVNGAGGPVFTTATKRWTDDLFLNGSVGGSYVDDDVENYSGATWDLGAAYRLRGALLATANVAGNHFSGGSQYLGTIGLQKYADPYAARCTGNWGHRFSWSLLFDQYTDTRFNSYITQLRYRLGFAVTDNLEIGGFYWDPLEGDDFNIVVPNATITIPFQTFETVGGYASVRIEDLYVSGSIGYVGEDIDSIVYQIGASQVLSDTTSLYVNASYQNDPQLWVATTGLSFSFGPGGSQRYRPSSGTYAANSRHDSPRQFEDIQLVQAETESETVRGQIPSLYDPNESLFGNSDDNADEILAFLTALFTGSVEQAAHFSNLREARLLREEQAREARLAGILGNINNSFQNATAGDGTGPCLPGETFIPGGTAFINGVLQNITGSCRDANGNFRIVP